MAPFEETPALFKSWRGYIEVQDGPSSKSSGVLVGTECSNLIKTVNY